VEKTRVENYLIEKHTYSRFMMILEEELIRSHAKEIIDNGFVNLLTENRVEDLGRMYRSELFFFFFFFLNFVHIYIYIKVINVFLS
jgi:hypothetical protein